MRREASAGRNTLYEQAVRLRRENALLKEKLAAAKAVRNDSSCDELLASLAADIERLKKDNAAVKDIIGDCGNALLRIRTDITELTCVTAEIAGKLMEQ